MKWALDSDNERVSAAVQKGPANSASKSSHIPYLVAVSKSKLIPDIIEAYNCGQRSFGENYIQDLEEESNHKEILKQWPDIGTNRYTELVPYLCNARYIMLAGII